MHERLVREILHPLIIHTIEVQETSFAFISPVTYSAKISYGTQELIINAQHIINEMNKSTFTGTTIHGWDSNFINNNANTIWLMENVLNNKIRNKIKEFDQFFDEQIKVFENIINQGAEYIQRLQNIDKNKEKLITIATNVKTEADKLQVLLKKNENMFHYYFIKDEL